MNTPYELPEGLSWREINQSDKDWFLAVNGATIPAEACAVTIEIIIRHPDGRERTCTDEWYPSATQFGGVDELKNAIIWQWRDGNFGCDCNRSTFFNRAAGEKPN